MVKKSGSKRKTPAKQDPSYSVYVVELCAHSLGQDSEKECVYVGQTKDKPFDRLVAHKRGGLYSNDEVRDHGTRLRTDLCDESKHANLTETQSYAEEWRLAKKLKEQDFYVLGGQGLPRKYVEKTIKRELHVGQDFTKLGGKAAFTIIGFDTKSLVLAIGPDKQRTEIPWSALEGLPAFLDETWRQLIDPRGKMKKTLDARLRHYVPTKTAPWVGAVLEAAGVIEVDRKAPIRIRFIRPYI